MNSAVRLLLSNSKRIATKLPFKSASLFAVPKRFCGTMRHYQNFDENVPLRKKGINDISYLERTEIEVRILSVLNKFDGRIDLNSLDFNADFEKDLGLDSLEITMLITSIEHEFHFIFEDNVFDSFKNFNQMVDFLETSHDAF